MMRASQCLCSHFGNPIVMHRLMQLDGGEHLWNFASIGYYRATTSCLTGHMWDSCTYPMLIVQSGPAEMCSLSASGPMLTEKKLFIWTSLHMAAGIQKSRSCGKAAIEFRPCPMPGTSVCPSCQCTLEHARDLSLSLLPAA